MRQATVNIYKYVREELIDIDDEYHEDGTIY